ncbi:unnamed protein product [Euphydryas editha]|uniref:Uncharacterized protein n=1 Tax=Euphydryas editha TaxID=104508 RepID=A0AAU9V1T9_EUPED|nr:unnamed protein product [Euphydryas editha]
MMSVQAARISIRICHIIYQQRQNGYALSTSTSKSSKLFKSLPFLDDMRQIWGKVVNETNLEDEDEESYKSPVNIPKGTSDDLIKPVVETLLTEPKAKPLPETASPALVKENKKLTFISEVKKTKVKPTFCDIALIVCCLRNSKLEQCFRGQGCFRQIIPGNVDHIDEI